MMNEDWKGYWWKEHREETLSWEAHSFNRHWQGKSCLTKDYYFSFSRQGLSFYILFLIFFYLLTLIYCITRLNRKKYTKTCEEMPNTHIV